MDLLPIAQMCVPQESEVVPMLVVSAAFMYGAWFIRERKKKKRKSRKNSENPAG
jgi:hypothetical protein